MKQPSTAQTDRINDAVHFQQLEHHHYQSNRKSNVSGVLEKDERFIEDTTVVVPRGLFRAL